MIPDPATLEMLPEGVIVLDAKGRVEVATRRAAALLGFADDIVGKSIDDVVAVRTEGGERCRLSSFVGQPGDRIAEQTLLVELPGPRRRPVAMAGTPQRDGRVVLTLRHGGRREQLDRLRAELIATVSHEIRSPLTSVKGFTRTMLGKWDRFSDAQKRVMLETINEDADRVTRLLTELLDVSRIDAGRVQLRRVPVNVGEVAAGIVERARVKTHAEDREVVIDVAAVRHAMLDPDKLEQILSNLVENALLHGEGVVTVRVVEEPAGNVSITVADEGPGIAQDQLRRIFEKFGRGRDVRRSGSGLGLYITRGLVVAHGGAIRVESELGSGTTFALTLPLDDTAD